MQRAALGGAVVLPPFLIIAGFFAYFSSGGKVGEAAVVAFVDLLTGVNPFLSFVFWMAAIAALFSTADSQIYAALITYRFDPQSGSMKAGDFRPTYLALAFAVGFCLLYLVIRYLEIPFEKLIFAIVPSALVLLPVLVDAAQGKRPSWMKLSLAAILYWAASIYGLLTPGELLYWNLAAALVPTSIALTSLAIGRLMRKAN